MNVTLKQLQAFVAIAHTRSFSAAAKVVHVSQPALTTMIKNLERHLGADLFDRDARGATLTITGRELLPGIERLMVELNETIAGVTHATLPRGGTVMVACIPSAAASFMPPLIASFRSLHPQIRVVLKDAMTENRGIVEMLRDGLIDFGVASPTDQARELQFRPLFDDELVALVSVSHPLGFRSSVDWQDLIASPLIGMSPESHVRQLTDSGFEKIGVSKPPYTEVSLITTAVGMARHQLGVTVLPSSAANVCDLEDVKVLKLENPVITRRLGFLYKSMTALSPAARSFMSFVEAETRRHCGGH